MTADSTELTFVRCPSCRSLVPAISTRCRMCGATLDPAQGSAAGGESDPRRSARVRQKTMTEQAAELTDAVDRVRENVAPAQNQPSTVAPNVAPPSSQRAGSAQGHSSQDRTAIPLGAPPSNGYSGLPAGENAHLEEDPLQAYIEEVESGISAPAPVRATPVATAPVAEQVFAPVAPTPVSVPVAPAMPMANVLDRGMESDEAGLDSVMDDLEMLLGIDSDDEDDLATPVDPLPPIEPRIAVRTAVEGAITNGHSTANGQGSNGHSAAVADSNGHAPRMTPRAESVAPVSQQFEPRGEELREERRETRIDTRREERREEPRRDRAPEERRMPRPGQSEPRENRDSREQRQGGGREQRHEQRNEQRNDQRSESRGEQSRNEQQRPRQERSEQRFEARGNRGDGRGQEQRQHDGRRSERQADSRGESSRGEARHDARNEVRNESRHESRKDSRSEQPRAENRNESRVAESRPTAAPASPAPRTTPPAVDAALAGVLRGWLVSFKSEKREAMELRDGKFFVSAQSLKQSDLVIEDPSISTPHAKVIVSDSGLLVDDLMSEHGVFVRKQGAAAFRREDDSVLVESGDWLRFGEVEFKVVLVPE